MTEKYLKLVRQESCLVCGGAQGGSDPHHLKFVGGRGMGMKAHDKWAAPLCRIHHDKLHGFGRELDFWIKYKIDVVGWCEDFWKGNGDDADRV
jgi:hypothetical protein